MKSHIHVHYHHLQAMIMSIKDRLVSYFAKESKVTTNEKLDKFFIGKIVLKHKSSYSLFLNFGTLKKKYLNNWPFQNL